MKLNKIIRKVCVVNPEKEKKHARRKIQKTKREAKILAKKLGYSENSRTYEIFDLFYPGDSGFYERPLGQVGPSNIEEMLSMASAAGKWAKYTYIIDGEYSKNGKCFK